MGREVLNVSFCSKCVNKTIIAHIVVEVYGFKSFAKLLPGLLILCDDAISHIWPQIASDRTI